MTIDISTGRSRAKLPARKSPYWHTVRRGVQIGYLKAAPDAEGTWYLQTYDAATKTQARRALGALDHVPPGERFEAARKLAVERADHLAGGGTIDAMSVRQACETYVARLRNEDRGAAAIDAQRRFERWVYTDEGLAGVDVSRLTPRHLEDWRKRLRATAVEVNPHWKARQQRAAVSGKPIKGTLQTRARSASTLNRDMTSLRAALNLARDLGHVATDQAWRLALRAVENADRRRNVYLDNKQRRQLIDHAHGNAGMFLRALALLPLRPGALAALTVADFDTRLGVLRIGKDKTGGDRRITLPKSTAALFVTMAKDKLPAAPLLTRDDGRAWDKDSWKGPVKDAARAAGLLETVTAYTLRHSVITDLVSDIGLDLLTVAQLSGTSVAMIERHYGHLRADRAAAALAKLRL